MNKETYKDYIRSRLNEAPQYVRVPDDYVHPGTVSVRLPSGQPHPFGADALRIDSNLYNNKQLKTIMNLVKRPEFTTTDKETGNETTSLGYFTPPEIRRIKSPEKFKDAYKGLIAKNIDHRLGRMETLPELAERSEQWYNGANKIAKRMSTQYNHPLEVSAAVLATQSPQKDWYMNVSLAERIMHIHANHQETTWTTEMSKAASNPKGIFKQTGKSAITHQLLLRAVRGKKLGELSDPLHRAAWIRTYDESHNDRGHLMVTPEGLYGPHIKNANGERKKTAWGSFASIAGAVAILDHSDIIKKLPGKLSGDLHARINNTLSGMDIISDKLGKGHKVRSFYNDILQPNNPQNPVTIDSHAIRVAHGRDDVSGASPLSKHGLGGAANDASTGQHGLYPSIQSAIGDVATEHGLIPSALQSITWDSIRADNASKAQKAAIVDHHKAFRAGHITQDQLHAGIDTILGPQKPPTWAEESGNPLLHIQLESYEESYKERIRERLLLEVELRLRGPGGEPRDPQVELDENPHGKLAVIIDTHLQHPDSKNMNLLYARRLRSHISHLERNNPDMSHDQRIRSGVADIVQGPDATFTHDVLSFRKGSPYSRPGTPDYYKSVGMFRHQMIGHILNNYNSGEITPFPGL